MLQPGGVFAAWGYGLPICRGNAAATAAVESWAYGEDMLGPYWSARRRLIDEEYASISPPNDIFEPPMRRNLCSGRDCSIDFFVSALLLLHELTCILTGSIRFQHGPWMPRDETLTTKFPCFPVYEGGIMSENVPTSAFDSAPSPFLPFKGCMNDNSSSPISGRTRLKACALL